MVENSTKLKNKKVMRQGVYLYTKKEYRKKCLIDSNDSWFNRTLQDTKFLISCQNLIYTIDKAKIINFKLRKIETPLGICSIDDLSTGLKTILNILFLLKQKSTDIVLVNVNECGDAV